MRAGRHLRTWLRDLIDGSLLARPKYAERMAVLRKKTSNAPAGPTFVMPKVNPLSDPRMRSLVRSAATEGNYEAMLDAHALALRLLAPGDELWTSWLDGLESLGASQDGDLAVFVKFTREAAGIQPWGSLPVGARERLRAFEG